MKTVIYSLVLMLVLASCGNKETEEKKSTLLFPVIGPKKLNNGDTMYHTIAPFSFTNQYGEKVSDSTTKDKIYIANFFFALS